jgi:hypothetical protein
MNPTPAPAHPHPVSIVNKPASTLNTSIAKPMAENNAIDFFNLTLNNTHSVPKPSKSREDKGMTRQHTSVNITETQAHHSSSDPYPKKPAQQADHANIFASMLSENKSPAVTPLPPVQAAASSFPPSPMSSSSEPGSTIDLESLPPLPPSDLSRPPNNFPSTQSIVSPSGNRTAPPPPNPNRPPPPAGTGRSNPQPPPPPSSIISSPANPPYPPRQISPSKPASVPQTSISTPDEDVSEGGGFEVDTPAGVTNDPFAAFNF